MAFGKRATAPETPVAVEEEVDILSLSRLNMHPLVAPLYARREGLHQRKAQLLDNQRQLEAVRQDFEKLHALALAEEEPEIMYQWRDLKSQLQDCTDQLGLIEAGLDDLDAQLDASMGELREVVQGQIDALFLPKVRRVIAGVQDVLEDNRELHTIENCSHRLLQTGNLELFCPWLEAWLFRLERKLNLLAPK
jgi:hypothetical protein